MPTGIERYSVDMPGRREAQDRANGTPPTPAGSGTGPVTVSRSGQKVGTTAMRPSLMGFRPATSTRSTSAT